MAIYGDYELSRRLYKGAFTSFFLAKRIDGAGPAQAAVRVLELPADMVEGNSRADWIARFLDAARVQQEVSSKSSRWAKIHDFAENADGAYYVTDYITGSVRDFIATRTPLSVAALKGLLEQVIDALIDLQTEKQRPHGNLKSSNILVRDKGPR